MKDLNLTAKQTLLLESAKKYHKGQVRKYTGEPYYNHLIEVAKLSQYINLGVEVALCHDLIEDTKCTLPKILSELLSLGYSSYDALQIVTAVDHLTDKFTKESYPTLNRGERKVLEADRLGSECNYLSASVKMADTIDNTKSIVEHDAKFAKVYLMEKKVLIDGMSKSELKLRYEAESCVLHGIDVVFAYD